MPEMIEVEYYRRLAERTVGRQIAEVQVPDPHCLGPATTTRMLRSALVGARPTAARRRGKLLVLDTAAVGGPRPSLGIRFGMTGGLLVDGQAAIDRLLYSPAAHAERWMRFRLRFADAGSLVFHDPRRLGRVVLAPDEEGLGPDAVAVGVAGLRRALGADRGPGASAASGTALKARLLDQTRIAGLGNLLVDEILWRTGLDPRRPAASLDAGEVRRLHARIRSTVAQLQGRGGSHTGDLMAERRRGGLCRRDGTPLERSTVGGRTTWWCPAHQR